MAARECINCGEEYYLGHGKPGFITECWDCGKKTEASRGNKALKGVMVYPHKTSAEIQILPAESADKHIAASSRHAKRTNLGHNPGTETVRRD